MVRLELQGDDIVMTFPYDPLTVARVKLLTSRYDKATRSWRVNRSRVHEVEKLFPSAVMPDGHSGLVGGVLHGFGHLLRKHQVDAFKFLARQSRCALFDPPGTGKTRVAIGWAAARGRFPVLVVCPKAAKIFWQREIEACIPGEPSLVLRGRSAESIAYGTRWVIINYDILEAWMKKLEAFGFSALIADEVQLAKAGKKTLRGGAMLHLAEPISTTLALTGSPLPNGRPVELLPMLKMLKKVHEQEEWKWKLKFTGAHQVVVNERGVRLYHRKPVYRWDFCLDAEAPIWMSDMTFKKIKDVQAGDSLVGWYLPPDDMVPLRISDRKMYKRKGRLASFKKARYTRATVISTSSRIADTIEVRTESGKTIICTPDHRWQAIWPANRNHPEERYAVPFGKYTIARVGRSLPKVLDVPVDVSGQQRDLARWLGGIYDGEGTWPNIAQTKASNELVWNQIKYALDTLKFPYKITRSGGTEFRLLGGHKTCIRFCSWCRPVKWKTALEETIFGSPPTTPDRVVSIRPLGKRLVYSLETTTGNYIAYGYKSKNSGASNLDDLHAQLSTFSLQRRKQDVLQSLPEIQHQVMEIEADLAGYEELREEMAGYLHTGDKGKALGVLTRMLMWAANAKVEAALEVSKERLNSGLKTCVFSDYLEGLSKMRKGLPHQSTVLEGRMSEGDRQTVIDRFQTDPSPHVLLCSRRATGLSVTLTAADAAIFLSLPWTPTDWSQAWGRIHRMGQTRGTQTINLICSGTYDEEQVSVLYSKAGIVELAAGRPALPAPRRLAFEEMLKLLGGEVAQAGERS